MKTQLIEEGAAALALTRPRSYEVIVIGGGQAGLAAGYHLARAGVNFTILDAHARVGDAWRKRWDSLRLFTPAWLDSLDGMPFPAPAKSFPTKDEMANYLEAYAEKYQLPILHDTRVERLSMRNGRFAIAAGATEFDADQVIVAMSNYQRAKLPFFASALSNDIRQTHSLDYCNPRQLNPGGVLIVGLGNSGAEIAKETLRAGHPTWIAGRETGHLPFRIEGFLGRHVFAPLLLRFVFHRLLTLDTPIGRKARAAREAHGTPLIRVKPKELEQLGAHFVERVVGVRDGLPLLENREILEVTNVIWCSGFQPGFEWIDLPAIGEDGRPRQEGGVSSVPGLYFIGLHFLYAMSSSMIQGVSRDARRIVRKIVHERSVLDFAGANARSVGG